MRKNQRTRTPADFMVNDMVNRNETDYILPGRAESYWMASTPESNYPSLPGDIQLRWR